MFTAVLVMAPAVLAIYAYVVYPALLWLFARRSSRPPEPAGAFLPSLTVVVISYNEAANIRGTIENLLRLDYPKDRIQFLMVSDGSTDGTDEIIRSYADLGVEYLRVASRSGKTAAENASIPLIRGDVVLNTDAAVRVDPRAARALVEPLGDPSVGVASGRDISVASDDAESNWGESLYVRYEMGIRELESRSGGIIGASGCLFAIRRELHAPPVPTDSFRDLAAPLLAFKRGYRTVSCRSAICYVPRTPSLADEYRRKVRTTARGLSTLWHHRGLCNPFRHGVFAWKLVSHKLCRWLAPLAAGPALVALLLASGPALRAATALGVGCCIVFWLAALRWPSASRPPRVVSFLAAAMAGNVAAAHAFLKVLFGDRSPVWEPTRRRTWMRQEPVGSGEVDC